MNFRYQTPTMCLRRWISYWGKTAKVLPLHESQKCIYSTQVNLHSESQLAPHFALPEFNPRLPVGPIKIGKVLRPYRYLRIPDIIYVKGHNLKIWILFFPWSKRIHINLRGIIKTFKQKIEYDLQVSKCCFGSKMVISSHLLLWGT